MSILTLYEFKKTIETLLDFNKENDKLTKILLKETYGFIDYHFSITSCVKNIRR